jgi:hypothetical protein
MTDNDQRNDTTVPGTKVWPDATGRAADPDDSPAQRPTQIYRDEGAQGTMPFDEAQPLRGARWERANLEPGTFVRERYRIERDLGLGGGESEIYLCQDEHMPGGHADRQVVLKLYRTDLAPKPEVLGIISNLTSPNLIRILDMGVWDGRFFEVLEYCRGGSMADNMPYATDALMDVLDQIVEGLDYCHQQGIIHRDIKPTNLLYRDTGRTDLVLTDFGISSYLRKWQVGGPDHTVTGTLGRRTLDYSAPELFGEGRVGFKTDYYGLGITLIHLLKGQSPFAGWTTERVTFAHTLNQIPIPNDLDNAFQSLIVGLTQRDPSNRWGFSQYRQWRNGAEIKRDDGRPWQHRPYANVGGFPYCPAATTPEELAWKLDEFDAVEALTAGHIDYWVMNFDREKAKKIRELNKNYEKNPWLTMKQLAWYLDSAFPPPWRLEDRRRL